MKYIRTEKGVYEFTDEMCINRFGHIAYKDRPFICICGVGNKVIKQADTIEELCDVFVVVNNTCFNMPQLLGTKIDKDYYKHEETYGAIWTNKGLIYVAKMNSEGKLVLI